MKERWSVSLEENDRILGSLQGNFIVYGKPKVTLYDNAGRVLLSREVDNNIRPVVSPQGRYLALVAYADRSPTELKTLSLEVLDSSGKTIWKIRQPAATSFYLTDSAAVIGVEGVPGIPPTILHLYDPSGKWVESLEVEAYEGLLLSPSGRRFIVDQGRRGLAVFGIDGQKQGVIPPAEKYSFDRDEQHIGIYSNGAFSLFRAGKEIGRFRLTQRDIVAMALNVESGLLAIISPQRFETYNPLSGEATGHYEITEPDKSFTTLDISSDGKIIACGVDLNGGPTLPKEMRHAEGQVYVFLSEGSDLIRHRETSPRWRPGLPRAAVTPGNAIIMETGGAIKMLTLP